MTDEQFADLIRLSLVYGSFPIFKQRITINRKNIERLKDLYHQRNKWGIEYLKQNPSLTSSDVKLIESL